MEQPNPSPSGSQASKDRVLIAAARASATALRERTRAGSAASLAAETLGGGAIPGHNLVRRLKSGGQGVVYQAIQRSTGRTAAVKVLREGALAQASDRARLEREVHILATLDHPSIVSVLDSGTAPDGQLYYAMDFVNGEPLDEFVRHRNLGVRETLVLIATVCEAVNAAHQRGVIHRDLKPGNILVDDSGRPHVLDFGLAKIMLSADEEAVTQAGQFVGSLPWSAPEQAEGQHDREDTRTDVYALGVVMYRALMGTFPYNLSGSTRAALEAIVHAPPAPMRGVRSGIDDEIETITLKCLAKDASRRYQTAGELQRDIEHYLAGRPIDAKRDSQAYVLRKVLARHRIEVGAAALLLVAVVVGSIVSLVLWRQAVLAREREAAMRESAQRAQKEAEDQAAISKAVSAFLNEDLFRSVDPRTASGRDITVKETLEAATGRASERLGGQPLVEAEVRVTLGEMCRRLSKLDLAETNLTRAEKVLSAAVGEEDPRTLSARFQLAVVYDSQERHAEAERLFAAVLEGRRRVLTPDHPDIFRTLNSLGIVNERLGRYDKAEEFSLAAFRDRARVLGEEDVDTQQSANNLAVLYWRMGRYREGRVLAQRALEGYSRRLPADNIDLAYPLNTLGLVTAGLAMWSEAESFFERSYAIRVASLGDIHPETYVSLRNMGMVREGQGRLSEALSLFERAHEGLSRAIGEHSPQALRCLCDIGRARATMGEGDRGEAIMLEALKWYREAMGADHPDVATTLMALAQSRLHSAGAGSAETGAKGLVVQWAGEAVDIRVKTMPPGSPLIAAAKVVRAMGVLRTEADASVARAELAAARAELAAARGELISARAELAAAWGGEHPLVTECDRVLAGP